jgi:hypothetical protein
MRRFLAAATFASMAMTTTAFAQEAQILTPAMTTAATTAATTLAQPADLAAAAALAHRFEQPRRPLMLPALYAGSAALQGYDAYSTLSVLKHGGIEANPLMKGLVKSPAAFIALKAGMATVSIVAAEKMWKNNNRVGAIATMLVSNGFMAYVAAHNASVLKRVQQ